MTLIILSRSSVDKRARNEQNWQATKPDGEVDEERKPLPIYATKFTREEIEAEPRRPKNKVAVMMGYSGSGYKGMQLCARGRQPNDTRP